MVQYAADYRKFSIRVNDRTYEFSDVENTRTAERALSYLMKLKQQEISAMREELAPKDGFKPKPPTTKGETNGKIESGIKKEADAKNKQG